MFKHFKPGLAFHAHAHVINIALKNTRLQRNVYHDKVCMHAFSLIFRSYFDRGQMLLW